MSLRYVAIIFAGLISACSQGHKIPDYVLSQDMDVQTYERVDHRFCSSIDPSIIDGNLDNSYWQCRLSLTKYRLKTDRLDPNFGNHNKKISDLATQISLKISMSPESSMAKVNQEIDNLDHAKCLEMGFIIDTDNQLKIDDYFSCRRFLLSQRNQLPPFDNLDYLKYQNQEYNISYIINQRVDNNIANKKNLSQKYPACIEHNIYSHNFSSCKEAQDNANQCFANIASKKLQKEVEQKVLCQKQSYHRFSDDLLIDQDENDDIYEELNKRSDFYNNNSFASIGIEDLSQFQSEKNPKEENIKSKIRDINSKTKLYGRFELTKLRQKYIILCQKNVDNEIVDYVKKLQSDCDNLKKYKLLTE